MNTTPPPLLLFSPRRLPPLGLFSPYPLLLLHPPSPTAGISRTLIAKNLLSQSSPLFSSSDSPSMLFSSVIHSSSHLRPVGQTAPAAEEPLNNRLRAALEPFKNRLRAA